MPVDLLSLRVQVAGPFRPFRDDRKVSLVKHVSTCCQISPNQSNLSNLNSEYRTTKDLSPRILIQTVTGLLNKNGCDMPCFRVFVPILYHIEPISLLAGFTFDMVWLGYDNNERAGSRSLDDSYLNN